MTEVGKHLGKKITSILKEFMTLSLPCTKTISWLLEGIIQGLRKADNQEISCVQNKTVVINMFKGEGLNLYNLIFEY